MSEQIIKALMISWIIGSTTNFIVLELFGLKKVKLIGVVLEDRIMTYVIIPFLNIIVALMVWITLASKLIDFLLSATRPVSNKIKDKKKKIKDKKKKKKMQKKNGLYTYLYEIVQLKNSEIENADIEQKRFFEQVEVLISEAVQKIEKNEDGGIYQEVMIQYEEVFKNVLTAMNKSIDIAGVLTPKITEEVLEICRSFLVSIEKQKEKELELISEMLVFERKYLEKIKRS